MKVHETRSHSHGNAEEDKVTTRKQKAENKAHEAEQSPKKAKSEGDNANGKSAENVVAEYEKLCAAVKDNLSTEQMREILEANGQDSSGSDSTILRKCQDLLFYGPLDKCPACNGDLEFRVIRYFCTGSYSEWATCTFNTKNPPRKQEPIKLPDSVLNSPASDLLKNYEDPSRRPHKDLSIPVKPFTGILISLMGRLSASHQYWRKEIEKKKERKKKEADMASRKRQREEEEGKEKERKECVLKHVDSRENMKTSYLLKKMEEALAVRNLRMNGK